MDNTPVLVRYKKKQIIGLVVLLLTIYPQNDVSAKQKLNSIPIKFARSLPRLFGFFLLLLFLFSLFVCFLFFLSSKHFMVIRAEKQWIYLHGVGPGVLCDDYGAAVARRAVNQCRRANWYPWGYPEPLDWHWLRDCVWGAGTAPAAVVLCGSGH